MKKQTFGSIAAILIIVGLSILLGLAGSAGANNEFGIPLFLLAIAGIFLIQWAAFIPAFLFKTEKFFDLTGSLTYISIALLTLLFSGNLSFRAILLTLLILIWAGRLGMFLGSRINKSGEDRRFREIKQSFWRFLTTWTLQGLWISFTAGAALAAIPSEPTSFGFAGLAGLLIWLVGFGIEVIADNQKSAFNTIPENKGKFIDTGLWAWSRHPNYFGEIVLWLGISIIALPALGGWQLVTLVSPIFVFLLLAKISGIPMLENRADQKWGGNPAYEKYKSTTSILIPLPPKEH